MSSTDTLYLFEHHGDHLESIAVRLNRWTDETLTPAQRAALRATVERALTMSAEVAQELDRRERAEMAAAREAERCLWCVEGFTVANVMCRQCGGTGRKQAVSP